MINVKFSRIRRYLLSAVGILLIGLALTALYLFLPPSADGDGESIFVSIPQGATTNEIAHILKDAGLIRSRLAFRLAVKLMSSDNRLKSGDYELNSVMDPFALAAKLRDGRVRLERITIPEGYTIEQIARMLEGRGLANAEAFIRIATEMGRELLADIGLDLPVDSLEGYLFPDTYNLSKGHSERYIINMMLKRFKEMALPVIQESPMTEKYGIHGVVTLASIIEGEAALESEKPRISAVFHNRLARGMALQSCATILYVLGERRERLLEADLEIDSPYNTYKNPGLPPGPIGNPGIQSIKAALEPAPGNELFFVAAGDGSHVFSSDFGDHVRAKNRIRRENGNNTVGEAGNE